MPDLTQIATDPDFLALDGAGKRQVMAHFDPEGFGKLDAKHQDEVLGHFMGVSIAHGAESIGLDPHLAVAQAHHESGFRESAVSPKGAEGVMQVMPETGAAVRKRMAAGTLPTAQGVSEPVAVGLAYQHDMKQRFGDDALALAAYNAGPTAVEHAMAKARAAGRPATIDGILPFLPHETQAYVTNVLHTAHSMRAAGGTGNPPEAPSAPSAAPQPAAQPGAPVTQGDPASTSTPTTTQAPDRNPLSLLAEHVVEQPAAEWNALAHKFGIPGAVDPHEARLAGLRYGYPGAEDWPQRDPEGALETGVAALAPAEGLWPVGAAAWTAAATLSNKHFADAVEGVLGLGLLARGGLKAYRYLRGRSPAEVAHLAAKAEVPERVTDVAVARSALRSTVERVETALQYHAEELSKVEAAERALPSTMKEVQTALGASGASPELAGRMLQATGGTARELGGEVGVARGMNVHLRKVGELYEGARKLGDSTGAVLPPKSADHVELLDAVDDYLKHGGAATDPIVKRIRDLGLVGIQTETGEVMSLRSVGDADAYLAMHPKAQKAYGPISYRMIGETYAELANVSPTPRAYATSTDRSARAFYRLVRGSLKTAMEKIEAGDPELRNAAAKADAYYRDFVVPYRRTAKATLGASVEPTQAFDRLIDRPEHLVRHLALASAPERQALADAWLDRLVRTHSNALGEIDFGGVLKDWNGADDTVRSLVAASGGADQVGGPARVLNEWAAKAQRIETSKDALASFKKSLTANKSRVLRQARDDVTTAITALRDTQRRVKHTGRLPVGPLRSPEDAAVLDFGTGMRMFGRMHLVLGIKDILTGNFAMAALQGAEAAFMMRRPRMVAKAVMTPVRGEDGPLLSAALHGLLQTLGPAHAVAKKAQQQLQSSSEPSSPQ